MLYSQQRLAYKLDQVLTEIGEPELELIENGVGLRMCEKLKRGKLAGLVESIVFDAIGAWSLGKEEGKGVLIEEEEIDESIKFELTE